MLIVKIPGSDALRIIESYAGKKLYSDIVRYLESEITNLDSPVSESRQMTCGGPK